jgi:N-terminal acetyltransferase B complex catalytic subunit
VRVGNAVAVRLYASLGYIVYRRVLEYYGGAPGGALEDAFDMRKRLVRDETGESVVPLKAPVTSHDIQR